MSGNLLAYYQQQMQPLMNAPGPLDALAGAGSALLGGYMQGQEDKRKREAEAAALKRQQEQDEIARTKRALEMGQTAMAAGRNETAAGILNQLQSSGALQRYAGISGDKIMGATVTDPQAVAQRDFAMGMMGNPLMAAFANPDALTAPTTRQDFSGDATTNALAGVFGRPPIKTAPGGHTIINPDGTLGETAPLIARPLDPLTAELRQAQTQRALRPPAGRSGGGGGGGRSSGARSGGSEQAASPSQPKQLRPSEINSVLSTVEKMRAAAATRHQGRRGGTDWAKADAEWRPKAAAYLAHYGLSIDDYFPQNAAPQPYQGAPYAPGYVPPQQAGSGIVSRRVRLAE